jgi:hypothetical protein
MKIFGERADLRFDTGNTDDAALRPDHFRRLLKKGPVISSNYWRSPTGQFAERAEIQNGFWGGFYYTNLIILSHSVNRFSFNIGRRDWGFWKTSENMVGLRWLARNDVVFDFPRSKLYLDQHDIGPLPLSGDDASPTLPWWERAKHSTEL